MLRLSVMSVAVLMAATAPLAAAEVSVDSSIDHVVVYPQGASVTRLVDFSLPAGPSVITVTGIPAGIDTSSLRLDGSADAGLEIRSVQTDSGKADPDANPERERLNNAIQDLRDQLQAMSDQQAALEAQRAFIQNLIEEGPRGFGELIGQGGGGIAQWTDAIQVIGQSLEAVQSNLRELSLQQRAMNEQIAELQNQLNNLPVEVAQLEVRIEVEATADASGTLSLSYQVGNARWAPAYDATLTTGSADVDPSLTLVRRAEITQQTGEDWNNVSLTLSTTRPAGGTQAPYLGMTVVQTYDDLYRYGGVAAMAPAPAMVADQVGREFDDAEAGQNMPVSESQAVADFGDFKADFVIPTPVTVASGAGVRSVRLATDELPARLFVQTVPRVSEQAYLTAGFTASVDAPVLAGQVNLFRDGAYVGTGSVGFTAPGEDVELGFGPDDQVRVTFTLALRETATQGLLTRYSTDERRYEITVENGHTRPIEITVTDRVPVSQDERITVDRLPETTEPTEEDADGQLGIISWTQDYEPGESQTFINAFRVTWPADLSVYGID